MDTINGVSFIIDNILSTILVKKNYAGAAEKGGAYAWMVHLHDILFRVDSRFGIEINMDTVYIFSITDFMPEAINATSGMPILSKNTDFSHPPRIRAQKRWGHTYPLLYS